MRYPGIIIFLLISPMGQGALSQPISSGFSSEIPSSWYPGKGLAKGDVFTYEICDMLLRIKGILDHCYRITLQFVEMLKGPYGNVWIVQAEIDHQGVTTNAIFQIDTATLDITTDGTSTPYADSVSRTIFWPKRFVNALNQGPLEVGSSWGNVATYTAPTTELVVKERVRGEDLQYKTFIVGYNIVESTTMDIVEDIAFPVRATVFKPTVLHGDPPLEFTFRLTDQSELSDSLYCNPETEMTDPKDPVFKEIPPDSAIFLDYPNKTLGTQNASKPSEEPFGFAPK